MIVNLMDSRSNALRNNTWSASAPRRHVARLVAGTNESIANIVRRVIEQSEGRRSIWLLRIMAHGSSGFLQLGGCFLNLVTCHEFSRLAGYFTPGGIGIALHSCGSASNIPICRDPEGMIEQLTVGKNRCITVPGRLGPGGGSGVEFLRYLAKQTRVAVRGGVNPQRPDPRFRYEGPSVIVTPDGRTVVVPDKGQLALDTMQFFEARAS